MWKNWQPADSNIPESEREFQGKVVQARVVNPQAGTAGPGKIRDRNPLGDLSRAKKIQGLNIPEIFRKSSEF